MKKKIFIIYSPLFRFFIVLIFFFLVGERKKKKYEKLVLAKIS
jgi:hypothetical protein